MPDVPEEIAAELDAALHRAGLVVPAVCRAGVLVAYAELRDQVALLRTGLSAADEPANVFRLHRVQPQ